MSSANQYRHHGLLHQSEKKGARRKPWFSRSIDSSSASRSSYSDVEAKHSHPVVAAHNPNVELSQISQLSMDSSFGTNSHSTNFADNFPLRQPSGSVGSYSHGHSPSSSAISMDGFKRSHRQQQQQQQQNSREGCHSLTLPSRENTNAVTGRDHISESIGSSSSFFSKTQRKPSLLQGNKKQKRKKGQKTRFASTSEDFDGNDAYTGSQGSLGASLSLSASVSKSSFKSSAVSLNGRRPSGNLFVVHDDLKRVRSRHDRTHIDEAIGNSSHHSPQKRPRHQNSEISHFRRDMDTNSHRRLSDAKDIRALMPIDAQSRISDIHQPWSSILNCEFSKAATPRKRLDVPYPLLESQLGQQQHELRLQQHDKHPKDHAGIRVSKMATIQVTQRRLSDSALGKQNNASQETMFASGRNDVRDECFRRRGKIENSVETTDIARVLLANQSNQEQMNGRIHNCPDNTAPAPGVERGIDPSKSGTISNDTTNSRYFSNEQANRNELKTMTTDTAIDMQERQPAIDIPDSLEAEKEQALQDFKKQLQDVLNEMESKARNDFNKILRTVTCTAETKLEQKAQKLRETTQSELDRRALKVQEATQSELERQAELVRALAQSELDRKQGEMEKSTEKLFELNMIRLEETSSSYVKKLEVCTEGNLARLSKFTETWLANSCSAIASRLKPYFFLTSETNISSKEHATSVVWKAAREQTRRKQQHSGSASTDCDRLNKKSATSRDSSRATFSIGDKSSSIQGEVSLTQASRSKSSHNSRKDNAQLRPLRRSKRTRQSSMTMVANGMDNYALATNGKRMKKSKENVRKNDDSHLYGKHRDTDQKIDLPLSIAIDDKLLCVTPTGGVSELKQESLRQKKSRKQKRSFADPDNSSALSTRKDMEKCAHVLPRRSTGQKAHSELNGISMPEEIIAYGNCNLSPLEEPKITIFGKTKRPRFDLRSDVTRACKSKIFSSNGRTKRRKLGSRTYTRRERKYDVTEKDNFTFE